MATLIIEETKDPPPNNTVNIANMQLFESQIVGNIKKKAHKKKIKAKNRAEELRNKTIEEILYKFNKEYSLAKESRKEEDSIYFKGERKPIKFNIDTIKRMEMKPYSWTLSKIKKLIIEISGSSNWTYLRHLIGEDLVNNPKYIRCPYRLCSDDNTFITFSKAQSIHLYSGHEERYTKPFVGQEFDGFDLENKIELHDLVNSWFIYFMRHGSRFPDPDREGDYLKSFGNTMYMKKTDCHYCIKAWADKMVDDGYFTHYNYDTLLNCLKDELIEGFFFVEDIGKEYVTCATFKRKEDDLTRWVKKILDNNVAQGYENFDVNKIYNYGNFNIHQLNATEMALKYKAFIITGPPGAGKTFWIQNFVKGLETQTKKTILLTAFFGKAVDNIESSSYNAFGPRVKFGTAHKKILFSKYNKGCCSTCNDYLKKWREGDMSFKKLMYKTISCKNPSCSKPFLKDLEDDVDRVIRQFKDQTPDIVIIDECSMLSLDLFHSILSVLMTKFHWKTQFIFIGDPDQIQPIGVGAIFEWMIQRTKIPVCKFVGSERIGNGDDDEEKKKEKQHLLNAFEAIRNEEENIPSRFKNGKNFIVKVLPPTGKKDRKHYKLQRLFLEETLDELIEEYDLNEDNCKFLTVTNGDDLKHDMHNDKDATYDYGWNGSRSHLNEYAQNKFNILGKKINKTMSNGNIYDTGVKCDSVICLKKNDYSIKEDELDYYNGMEGRIIKQEGHIIEVKYERDRMRNYDKDEDDDTYISNKTYIDKEIGDDLTLGYALTAHKSQGSSIRNTIIVINENHFMWMERPILLTSGDWATTENTVDGKKIFYTCVSRAKERVILIIMPKENRTKWVDNKCKGMYSHDEMADVIVNRIVKSKKKLLTKIFE